MVSEMVSKKNKGSRKKRNSQFFSVMASFFSRKSQTEFTSNFKCESNLLSKVQSKPIYPTESKCLNYTENKLIDLKCNDADKQTSTTTKHGVGKSLLNNSPAIVFIKEQSTDEFKNEIDIGTNWFSTFAEEEGKISQTQDFSSNYLEQNMTVENQSLVLTEQSEFDVESDEPMNMTGSVETGRERSTGLDAEKASLIESSLPLELSCLYCEKSFTDQTTFVRHCRSHMNNVPFLCNICGAWFVTEAALFYHRKVHNKVTQKNFEGVRFCKKYKKSFVSSLALIQHKNCVDEIQETDVSVELEILSTLRELKAMNETETAVLARLQNAMKSRK